MDKLIKKIKYYGLDPILREYCFNVDFKEDNKKIVDYMISLLKDTGHLGLSAPQIGINKNIIVFKKMTGYDYMLNPLITYKARECMSTEECLSLPNIKVKIPRYKHIMVEYYNYAGELQEEDWEDQQAIIIQHEYDHLKGTLIIDYLSSVKRKMCLNNKYKRILKYIQKVRNFNGK